MNSKTTSKRLGEVMEMIRRQRRAELQADTRSLALSAGPPRFTVALSREAGANGPKVARLVGERLDWPVYDRELLLLIADEMGLRARLLEGVDEKHKSWLRECAEALAGVSSVGARAYVHRLAETVLALGARGGCVIVGRGAAQILPAATTLRVRLVGPQEERITAVQDKFDLSREEAAAWVAKTDEERVRFVKEHFHKDPTDARHYDLVINAMRYPAEQCADFIVEALRRLETRGAKLAAPAVA